MPLSAKTTPEQIFARQRRTMRALASAIIQRDPRVNAELANGASLPEAIKAVTETISAQQSRSSGAKLLSAQLKKIALAKA